MSPFLDSSPFRPHIYQLHSQDIDEIKASLRSNHWRPDMVQLKAGPLEAYYSIANLGGIQFARTTVNVAMLHRSAPPLGAIAWVFPLHFGADCHWCGYPLGPQRLGLYHTEREGEMVGKGARDLAIVTLSQETLSNSGSTQEQEDLQRLLASQRRLLTLNPDSDARLRTYLQQLFALVQNAPQTALEPGMQTLIHQDFLPILWDCLSQGESEFDENKGDRHNLLKKVQNYVQDNLDKPLTLQDLCQVAGVKPRTLQTQFLDLFGVSPMAYVKVQRLHGIREQLKRADPAKTTVIGIATQWGFWHMGHFSRDYRHLFGETPSQTLKRV